MANADDHPASRPRLPRTLREWVCLFGPGAIIASLTIGTGELVFSTRGGALFGYDILFLFVIISLLKWALVISTSRHMILTGVHPYERMLELPGPRGWLPIMLLIMAMVCLPIWISFHAGVIGNLTSWVTGTGRLAGGGMDYVWGAVILIAVLLLSATGGYSVLERVQLVVVGGLVCCAMLTLFLYRPDWLELLKGLLPRSLSYPEWLEDKYPQIARHSVWVETTRYVGVIGGAGFDYLAYTSWIREKEWGILPDRATPEQLEQIAADPKHEVRRWIAAPLVDCGISFALIVAFSAVFVVCGAMILRPEQIVPDEKNLLSLQSRFVTAIHPLLLPLYVTGAFLTMLGTLYGTIEIGCSIADEIVRSIQRDWNSTRAKRLKTIVLGWCGPTAILILVWLFIRQANLAAPGDDAAVASAALPVEKPRLLLAILTPVNLFTGVLSCGLICILVIWMDRRALPAALQPPRWLVALNGLAAAVFLAIGLKGYWDNENRWVVVIGMASILLTAVTLARFLDRKSAGAANT